MRVYVRSNIGQVLKQKAEEGVCMDNIYQKHDNDECKRSNSGQVLKQKDEEGVYYIAIIYQ